MTFLSKFRQNLFQLTLLLWGSMLLLASAILILTTVKSSFEFFFFLLTAIPQVFSFWGLHFIFSYIYRSIPSKKVNWIILFIEVLTISIPIIIENPYSFITNMYSIIILVYVYLQQIPKKHSNFYIR